MNNFNILFAVILSGFLVFSACKKGNDISNKPEKIYYGDLINPSISELQTFYDNEYNVIDGNVEFANIDSLFNMKAFSHLRKITGSFRVEHNYHFFSFSGLNNLESIGNSFVVFDNNAVVNFKGLDNLQSVSDGFIISVNTKLESLEGLGKLQNIDTLFIIEHNTKLNNLDGLYQLKYAGNLLVFNNAELKSLSGLTSIEVVRNKLVIEDNPDLTDFCSIRKLLTINGVGGYVGISNNLFNPSTEDIIAGNCSQ